MILLLVYMGKDAPMAQGVDMGRRPIPMLPLQLRDCIGDVSPWFAVWGRWSNQQTLAANDLNLNWSWKSVSTFFVGTALIGSFWGVLTPNTNQHVISCKPITYTSDLVAIIGYLLSECVDTTSHVSPRNVDQMWRMSNMIKHHWFWWTDGHRNLSL